MTEKQIDRPIKVDEHRVIESKSPHRAASSVSLPSSYKRLFVPWGLPIKQEPEYINLFCL